MQGNKSGDAAENVDTALTCFRYHWQIKTNDFVRQHLHRCISFTFWLAKVSKHKDFRKGKEAQPLCHALNWPEEVNGRWLLLGSRMGSAVSSIFISLICPPLPAKGGRQFRNLYLLSDGISGAYGDLLPCFSHASGCCCLGACLFLKINYFPSVQRKLSAKIDCRRRKVGETFLQNNERPFVRCRSCCASLSGRRGRNKGFLSFIPIVLFYRDSWLNFCHFFLLFFFYLYFFLYLFI